MGGKKCVKGGLLYLGVVNIWVKGVGVMKDYKLEDFVVKCINGLFILYNVFIIIIIHPGLKLVT